MAQSEQPHDKRPSWAIIRLDHYLLEPTGGTAGRIPIECVTVKRIMWDRDEGQAEVDRLNALASEKGQADDYSYHLQYTRADDE